MNSKRLDEKDPGETVPLSWDFAEDLGDAEIDGAPDIVCEVDQSLRRGTDPDAAGMLVGTPEVQGTQVVQLVSAGIDGVDYKVRCAVNVNTSPDTVIYKTSILPVRVQ